MLWSFFLRTLLIGSLTFGGGYAMISALQQEFVYRRAWLTQPEFSGGVAIGQVTPGPLMIMIAFLGYKIAGLAGALLGTLALFAPSFILALLLARYQGAVKTNPTVQAAQEGIHYAVVGLLAAAAFSMAGGNLTSIPAIILAAAAILFLGPARLDPAWVFLAAGLAGALLPIR